MQLNKLFIYSILILVLSSLCFAVTGQVTSFNGQTNPFNITFIENQNQSFILPIPSYAYVNNVSFKITGIPFINTNNQTVFTNNLSSQKLTLSPADLNYTYIDLPRYSNLSYLYIKIDSLFNQSRYNSMFKDLNNLNSFIKGEGIILKAKENTNINIVGIANTSNPTRLRVYNGYTGINCSDDTDLNATYTRTGDNKYFVTSINLTKDMIYSFILDGGDCTTSWSRSYNGAASYPTESTDVNFTGGFGKDDGTGNLTMYTFDITYLSKETNEITDNLENIKMYLPILVLDYHGSYNTSGVIDISDYIYSLKNCNYNSAYTIIGDNCRIALGFKALKQSDINISLILNNYTGLYPFNLKIYQNGVKIFNRTNEYRTSELISENITLANLNILINNITISSEEPSKLNINLTNTSYSYGIDNCSNSFNIPSNATILNFTGLYENNNSEAYIDITSESYFKYGLYGESQTNIFYPLYTNIKNKEYCGYPSWAKFSTTPFIVYNRYTETLPRTLVYENLTLNGTLTTIPLYVLDSANSDVLQINLQINDLTGQYYNSTGIIRKLINASLKDITIQDFDIEAKIVTYLIQNSIYSFSVRNSLGQERVIGNLIADTAGTKTITLPTISFLPDSNLGKNVLWDWDLNRSIAKVTYTDSGTTSSITYNIINSSNQVFYTTTSNDITTFTGLYLNLPTNQTFTACINATSSAGQVSDCQSISTQQKDRKLSGWSVDDEQLILNWVIVILVMIIGCYAGQISGAVGMGIVSLFMLVAVARGWFDIGTATNTTIVILCWVITGILYYIEENEK